MTPVHFDRILKFPNSDITYDLTGIIVHEGNSVNNGHYYANIRSLQMTDPHSWFQVNDSIVSPTDENTIHNISCATNEHESTPYILSYRSRELSCPATKCTCSKY